MPANYKTVTLTATLTTTLCWHHRGDDVMRMGWEVEVRDEFEQLVSAGSMVEPAGAKLGDWIHALQVMPIELVCAIRRALIRGAPADCFEVSAECDIEDAKISAIASDFDLLGDGLAEVFSG